MSATLFPCPCCGYLVFHEPLGSYAICRVCGWEDDISQLRFPSLSGANELSLIEAQQQFMGHLSPGWTPKPYAPLDAGWHMIDPVADNIDIPAEGIDYDNSYPSESASLYYWRSNYWRHRDKPHAPKVEPLLRRFWFQFETTDPLRLPGGIGMGCGVTAANELVAIEIVERKVFKGGAMPRFSIQPDIDVSILDPSRVRPNMNVPTRPGVWFPLGYEGEQAD